MLIFTFEIAKSKLKMYIFFRGIMILITTITVSIGFAGYAFVQQSKFGNLPKGERLERIKKSPNYKDGEFKNIENTPPLTEGHGFVSILYDWLLVKRKRQSPEDSIPSMKTGIYELSSDEDVLIWFGHSSYYLQIDGKKILVDPVFSGSSSPIPNTVMAYKGTDRYTVEDFPEVDYLFISHDHWDHTDFQTLKKLKTKVGKVICGLGVGQHFETWGYAIEDIYEKDWGDQFFLDDGFKIDVVTARHFSGRGLSRNKSLWVAFVLKTPNYQLFIGGDSGYGKHFKEIGNEFGSFDLVVLENGQYDKQWKYIHMMPAEVLKAGKDLNAKRIFPVHSSKFTLANHAWDDPLKKITELHQVDDPPLLTPIIGEKVNLKDPFQTFSKWWEGIN